MGRENDPQRYSERWTIGKKALAAFAAAALVALVAMTTGPLVGAAGAEEASFSAATNFPADLSPASVATADLDGDGDQDLAISNFFRTTSRCC